MRAIRIRYVYAGWLLLFSMATKRNLYISISVLKEAIDSKDRLKALAFSVAIKLCFRNSGLKSATNRNIQKKFHVSASTASKVVKDGLAFGYLRYDERIGMLVANKIKEENCWNCELLFDCRPSNNTESLYTLRKIEDELRKAYLLNHISKQTDTVNTLKSATDGHCSAQVRKAQRKLKRMPPTSGCHEQLSLYSISNLIHVCKTKARRLKNALILAKDIIQHELKIFTSIDPSTFNSVSANAWFRKSGYYGFLMHNQDGVFCQLANIYKYNSTKIIYMK